MQVGNLIRIYKRKVISSSFFWRIRHLLQPSWVRGYEQKRTPQFYFDYISTKNISSILDFGCASGSLLYDLKEKNPNLISYGIDINKKALAACNRKFNLIENKTTNYCFYHELNENNLRIFLKNNNLQRFDLVVFDRVLYCLSEIKIIELLKKLSCLTDKILIDDFEITNGLSTQGYIHRDWINILGTFGFKNITNIPTIHSEVDSANAKTLVFKNELSTFD
tara:strand:- start:1775 stop:2440 length:666 start_codon:yes stop_codon:yes gene_type:complete